MNIMSITCMKEYAKMRQSHICDNCHSGGADPESQRDSQHNLVLDLMGGRKRKSSDVFLQLAMQKRNVLVGENSSIWLALEFDMQIEIRSMHYGTLRGTLCWMVIWLVTKTKMIMVKIQNAFLELTICWCFVPINSKSSHDPLV